MKATKGRPLKKANIIVSTTLRNIINEINDKGIKKDDIISLVKVEDQFMLIYYE